MSVESYEIRKSKDVEINGTIIGKDTGGVKKVIRKEITKMWQTRWEISTKSRMFTFFNSTRKASGQMGSAQLLVYADFNWAW